MLVLTRKASQQIKIGDDVVVTILAVKGNTVKIGIEAPREVRVLRGELTMADEPSPAAAPRAVSRELRNTVDFRSQLSSRLAAVPAMRRFQIANAK